ncbi:hypothetical protein ANN_02217 [Periplaneta americana]|uniref:Uncharacterized protein n=1 Tax=Periplaneta americana TaxID=6978 RepID=A0ABQ8TXG0_PERAM|nr:hypothetical protein ANN_02217 [Periplaneta americana]
MICFLMTLVGTGRFSRVVYKLSMRGHSYLLNKWDFSTVKSSLNKVDRHYTGRDLIEIIASASHKFRVRQEREKSLQYQHTTTSSGQRRNGYIEALLYIGGLQTKHFLFAFGAEIALPTKRLTLIVNQLQRTKFVT